MQLQENMVVADRFRLVRMIGRGGMGSVWQAVHQGLDTPCAVKFIEGELANVSEAHARFEREAKAAAQLRSPHVVKIFDHGVWQGHPYIAMELLDGEDLGKRLARNNGKLSGPVVTTIVQQVCRALSKAHQAGVVHRDLKPDNIFIVNDDDREIVKILDFGVAKSAAQALDGSNTKTGAMLGTPYYMSPEQAQGIKSVDSRSDLWSLAVIVFQCLTGRLPFESEALGDLLVKIIVSPIPSPLTYNPALPPTLEKWWLRAADRNPDNRFPTAKEFIQELGTALGTAAPGGEAISDRNLQQRVGGGTAMLSSSPGHMANTPFPVGQQTAAMGMGTPNPAMGTPNPAGPPAGPAPGFGSSPGYGSQGPGDASGYGGAPPPHQPHLSTGNPVAATFSGVEPPATVPKKGPPIALFAVLGVLLVVGLGFGAVAIRGKAAAGGEKEGPTASASVTPPPASADPPPPATAAQTAAAADPPPPAETAAPAPAVSSAPAAAAAAPPAAVAVAHRPKPAVAAPAAKPAAPAAAPAASAKPAGPKPPALGF